jgi:hypothetical protein
MLVAHRMDLEVTPSDIALKQLERAFGSGFGNVPRAPAPGQQTTQLDHGQTADDDTGELLDERLESF